MYVSLKKLFFFTLLCFFLSSGLTYAQSLGDLPGSDPLIVKISPENPRPGQRVTVSIESYAIDLERSTIVWALDGIEAQRGSAMKSYMFTAGKAGSEQRVTVSVTTVNSTTLTKTVYIRPNDVEIIWQSRSYTPP